MTVKPLVAVLALICLALAFTTLGPSSCVSSEQVQQMQAQITVLEHNLAVEKEKQAAIVAAPTSTPEEVTKAKENIDRITKLEKDVAEGKAMLAKAMTPQGTVDPGGVVAAASGLLPPPWGQLVPWAVGAVAVLFQQGRLQSAGKKIETAVKQAE